ncbi:transcriptional-regulating factor 1 [Plakobranchus ocellatus]|uniref:Transcriptional-regulating factor 1 n=1 Tax=Plakobranchus ocellatus TaxID=259542 RepID=A0AAV3ZJ06_9GAST|nr:transcriptional-regulating factor 1 [Plakobranchus ocellatus]
MIVSVGCDDDTQLPGFCSDYAYDTQGLSTSFNDETDSWNASEMERFCKSLLVYDKDFFKVAKDVSTKSVKQCIQFYYVWKKVCPDDYKRLRHSRNKHGDYNTRRQTERAAAQAAAQAAAAQAAVEKVEQQEQQQQQQEPQQQQQQQQQQQVVEETAENRACTAEENEATPDMDNLSTVSDNDEGSMAGPDSIKSVTSNTASSTPTRVDSPAPAQTTCPQFQCVYDGCNVVCSSKHSLKRHMFKQHGDPASKPAASSTKPTNNSNSNSGGSSTSNKPSSNTSGKKSRPSTPSRSPVYDQFGEEIFPCKLCGRVFAKVKSRSAHMKSHKIAEQSQQEKKANDVLSSASYGGF